MIAMDFLNQIRLGSYQVALPVPWILRLCNYLQNVVAITYIVGLQLSTFLFYNKQKDTITDQLAQHIFEADRSKSMSTCNGEARRVMKKRWITLEDKLSMVSGKYMIKKIDDWLKRIYHVSCSRTVIMSHLKSDEISREIRDVFDKMV